jgi:SOS response regulatory protein OraA/RecX
MTYLDAADRLQHLAKKLKDYKYMAKHIEALKMAIGLLLWAEKQPTNLFESETHELMSLDDVINEYYNQGLLDGARYAKISYKNKN